MAKSSGQGVRAGRAYIEYNAKDNTARQTAGIQRRLKAVASSFKNVALGVAAIALPIAGFVRGFVKAGDQIDKMMKRTGLAAETLSRLGFAAEQSGASLEAVERGLKGMARFMLDASRGTETAKEILGDLRMEFGDIARLSPEDQFKAFAEAISRIDDPTKKAGLAMKVFGKAGADLIPLLNVGRDGIAELEKEADELGRTITKEMAGKAAELADEWNRAASSFKSAGIAIGSILAPAVGTLATVTKDALNAIAGSGAKFSQSDIDQYKAEAEAWDQRPIADENVVKDQLAKADLAISMIEKRLENSLSHLPLIGGPYAKNLREQLEYWEQRSGMMRANLGRIGAPPGPSKEYKPVLPKTDIATTVESIRGLPKSLIEALDHGAESLSTAINQSTGFLADSINAFSRAASNLPISGVMESRSIYNAAAIQTLQGGPGSEQKQILNVNKQLLRVVNKIERILYDLGINFQ